MDKIKDYLSDLWSQYPKLIIGFGVGFVVGAVLL